MNIVGILITALPEQCEYIKPEILALGAEIHEVTKKGQMVVTLEHPNDNVIAETMIALQNIHGVLNASMIYQHSE